VIVLAVVCAVAACGLLAEPFLHGWGSRAALGRVAGYGTRPAAAVLDAPSARRRLPGARAFAGIALRLAPGRDRITTAGQLQAAGLGRDVDRFLAFKTLLALSGLILGGAIGLGGGPTRVVAFAAIAGALGFSAPDFVVGSRSRNRRERMLGEFPNALDLLAVIVEAGIGLDAALGRYATTATGPLADEIGLLATELRVAGSREEAFARFVERIPSSETRSFARAVAHADRLGVSLTGTLRAQASDARFRRQAAAEEKANKAPVKMLFPTVLCVFPALFVVVVGPPFSSLMSGL
jgi:tight adherence protein C